MIPKLETLLYDAVLDLQGRRCLDHDPAEATRLSRELGRSLKDKSYLPSEARLVQAVLDKPRWIVKQTFSDQVVSSVLAVQLSRLAEAQIHPGVHSFRKGRSSWGASRVLSKFLRQHQQAHASPKNRGLWVFRGDIRKYGESIPVHDSSLLWQQLWELLQGAENDLLGLESKWVFQLLRGLIRPRLQTSEGKSQIREKGTPTGTPLEPLLLNLYLAPLDQIFGASPGIYLRYGDDLLFACEEKEIFEATLASSEPLLERLGLSWNTNKQVVKFWSGSGAARGGIRGTQYVEFLGLRIHFRGAIGISQDKQNRIVEFVREAICREHRMKRALPDGWEASPELYGKGLGTFLHPKSRECLEELKELYLHCDDRAQMKTLDRAISLSLLPPLCGKKTARLYRKHPPSKLAQLLGIPRIQYERNHT